MKKSNVINVGLSLCFVLLGAAFGWWIIHELIHPDSALRFLYGALAMGMAVLYVQVLLALKTGDRLVPQLLLWGGFYVSMAWAALCFFMPLMFFPNLTNYAKLLSVLIVVLFCIKNIHVSLRNAKELWQRYGAFAFTNHLNVGNASVDWEKVARVIDVHRNVIAVGIPRRWHAIISKILYTLAVAGLYLAGLYSIFAVITWALPATIIAAVLLQHASHLFFQAYSVWIWERDNGTVLRSTSSPTKRKRK